MINFATSIHDLGEHHGLLWTGSELQATWYTSAVAMGMITASDFCTQSLSLVQAMQ